MKSNVSELDRKENKAKLEDRQIEVKSSCNRSLNNNLVFYNLRENRKGKTA